MAFNTYQLRFKNKQPIGTVISVDGPYDTYGVVVAHININDNGTLHIIRGIGHKHPDNY